MTAAAAADHGIHGHTFQIEEADLLLEIQTKLYRLNQDGLLDQYTQALLEKTKKSLLNPPAVKNIRIASRDRVFYYDPSIMVPYDLKDHKGRIFQRRGTRVNPLKLQPMRSHLVFIQGDKPTQVKWAEENLKTQTANVKIILVSGSPFELMEHWEKPVFFDQKGILTSKLGIKAVPAIVEQEEEKLKISEIYLKEAS